ncbi:MAG: hypothetical protein COU69_00345 [Candidatus Pacebacteria bacterium CG10_big_fil_rev_8_21_14_0_10_56_10]|nr:MAG: hypothetical protein COU69_00345 [Candidatus Pacebacteria bacterium CG10_big_fil_rev_8_21_14_0_10_56_10]
MSKKSLVIVLLLYVVSAALSFGAFSILASRPVPAQTGPEPEVTASRLSSLLVIDPNEPLDQACPLSGQLYTQTERNAWEEKRPLAVMIENAPDARPQSGLSQADVVFEAVAEGGVTRFMGLFYCDVQREDTTLAPVRSARTYFVDYASGFNLPLYVHVGGANVPGPTDALGQISDYGWNGRNDLNQFSIGYPTFVRDYNRLEGKALATEHTMVATTEGLWKVAAERGWGNVEPDRTVRGQTVEGKPWQEGYRSWQFEDGETATEPVQTISYEFWTGYDQYAVDWQYDQATNTYLRSHGGEAHIDLNNDQRVAAANVIALLTTEKGPINEKKHMLYGTTGTGDALIFRNGEAIEGSWSKQDRESELKFFDDRGREVSLARGMVWISVLNEATQVQYQ